MAGSPLSGIAGALVFALDPLRRAMQSPEGLLWLLRELGWQPALDDLVHTLFAAPDGAPGAYDQFTDLANTITSAIDTAEEVFTDIMNPDQDVSASEITGLIRDFRSIIAQVDGIRALSLQPGALPDALSIEDLWISLRDDLPDYLLVRYLRVHQAELYEVLALLGLVRESLVPEDEDVLFRIEYTRREILFDEVSALLEDPLTHLQQVYRWGGLTKPGDPQSLLDATRIAVMLERIMRSVGLPGRAHHLTDALTARYIGTPLPPVAQRPLMLTLPLLRRFDADPSAYLALEIAAIPSGSIDFPQDFFDLPVPVPQADSLLITHQTLGGVDGGLQLTDGVHLGYSGSVDASHQLNIHIKPGGVELDLDPGVSFDLGVSLSGQPGGAEAPWLLFGARDGTRITLGGLSGGVTLEGETGSPAVLDIQLGLDDLAVTLAAGEGDGLFNSLLGSLEIGASFDLGIGYNPESGVTFNGSGGITFAMPLDHTIGPVTLDGLEATLGPVDASLRLEVLLSASLNVGPIYAAVERVGVYLSAEPAADGDGMVGPFDIAAGFVPPSGYAVSLDADPIFGGGYVAVLEHEYRGALALNFSKIGFSAYAILTTEYPDGSEGYSFAASIFAEFSVPLAYGFFLTGLGGFVGINRTIDSDAMRDVLYDGRLDGLLFPSDPIATAPQILEDMAAILPPMQGQHVIGPCARISWGQPRLIDITLGVMIELGDEIRLVILGGLSMILPEEDKVLVALRVQFMGEIDFAAGTISFDATLEGSRVLTFGIDGDIAIRTGWGAGIEHIASFGGLHPQYPQPANLPDLARLSISFGGNNPRISLSSYFALTQNSLQFGARADLYAEGPKVKFVGQTAAEGFIAFDALIYFNPFSFLVGLRGGLSILVDGEVKAGLFFALELAGPNTYSISGEVWVKVLGVKVRFAIAHTWGNREDLPTYRTSAAELLYEAIQQAKGFEPVSDGSRDLSVAFRAGEDTTGTIDPLGGLKLEQSAAPLGIALEKVGEAEISGPSTLDLVVRLAGADQTASPVMGSFVRGHFFDISKQDRLRAPVLESHKAGVEIGAGAGLTGSAAAQSASYEYEIIVIGMHDSETGWQAPEVKGVLKTDASHAFQRSDQLGAMTPVSAVSAQLRPAETVEVVEMSFRLSGGGAGLKTTNTVSEALSLSADAPEGVVAASYIGDAA